MATEVHPVEVSDADFESKVLKSDVPVVVDFWAPWCAPCRRMAPIFEELAGEYTGRVQFAKVNVDEAEQVPVTYSTFSIPTLIIFKGGQEVNRIVGLTSKDRLAAAIDATLQ
ncbi:MAG: thioredoxin [Chloroflexota bacterium]|nr:thioredoxin [Chloroflexota bacterium]